MLYKIHEIGIPYFSTKFSHRLNNICKREQPSRKLLTRNGGNVTMTDYGELRCGLMSMTAREELRHGKAGAPPSEHSRASESVARRRRVS